MCVAYDNGGSNGADPYSSIVDSRGGTWTARQNVLRDPGASSAGLVVRIFTSPQDNGTLTTSDTITLTLGASSGSDAVSWTLMQVSRGATAPSYVTGATTSGSGTSSTITSGTISNGNMIIGCTGVEDENTLTPDSDTSNGSWSTHQTAVESTNGTDALSMRISSQRKVVTAAATQTYDLSWSASTDYAVAWIEVG